MHPIQCELYSRGGGVVMVLCCPTRYRLPLNYRLGDAQRDARREHMGTDAAESPVAATERKQKKNHLLSSQRLVGVQGQGHNRDLLISVDP
jgi:hypothetical protein